jgi:hypothetical protein
VAVIFDDPQTNIDELCRVGGIKILASLCSQLGAACFIEIVIDHLFGHILFWSRMQARDSGTLACLFLFCFASS